MDFQQQFFPSKIERLIAHARKQAKAVGLKPADIRSVRGHWIIAVTANTSIMTIRHFVL